MDNHILFGSVIPNSHNTFDCHEHKRNDIYQIGCYNSKSKGYYKWFGMRIKNFAYKLKKGEVPAILLGFIVILIVAVFLILLILYFKGGADEFWELFKIKSYDLP